jgi:hypothetical protein
MEMELTSQSIQTRGSEERESGMVYVELEVDVRNGWIPSINQ